MSEHHDRKQAKKAISPLWKKEQRDMIALIQGASHRSKLKIGKQ